MFSNELKDTIKEIEEKNVFVTKDCQLQERIGLPFRIHHPQNKF